MDFYRFFYLVKQILLAASQVVLIIEPHFVQIWSNIMSHGMGLTNLYLPWCPHSFCWWPFQEQASQWVVSHICWEMSRRGYFYPHKNPWGKKSSSHPFSFPSLLYVKNVILRATSGISCPWGSADTLERTGCKLRKSFLSSKASPNYWARPEVTFIHLTGCRYVISSLSCSGHLFPVLVQEIPAPSQVWEQQWEGKVTLPDTV